MNNSSSVLIVADLIFLGVAGMLGWVGIFSKSFPDNFVQRVGLGIIAIMMWARAWDVYTSWNVGQPVFVWIHVGIFFFSVGTWFKFTVRILSAKYHLLGWRVPYERRHAGNLSSLDISDRL